MERAKSWKPDVAGAGGLGLVVGSGIGALIGLVVLGAVGLAPGLIAGAAIGLVVGSAVSALSDRDGASTPGSGGPSDRRTTRR